MRAASGGQVERFVPWPHVATAPATKSRIDFVRQSPRVPLAPVNPVVGDLEGNARLVIEWIGRAREQAADVVCFPELVLTGYPPEDLVLKRSFVRDNLRQLDVVAKASKGITAVVGFVDDDGATFNAAAIMNDGEVKAGYQQVF